MSSYDIVIGSGSSSGEDSNKNNSGRSDGNSNGGGSCGSSSDRRCGSGSSLISTFCEIS